MDDVRVFPPDSDAVAEVRSLVCRTASVDRSHPAVLIASELATNAIVHTRDSFTVAVHANEVIRIEVTDESSDRPQPARGQIASTGGRLGLRIVEELSEDWGSEVGREAKTVWAEVVR